MSTPPARPRVRPHLPSLVAWGARGLAVVTVLDLFLPARHHHGLKAMAVMAVLQGVAIAARIGTAGILLLLASALSRRKRRAWVIALVAVLLALLATLDLDRPVLTVAYFVALVVLIVARREFTGRSERGSRTAALRVFAVLGTLSLTAAMLTVPHAPHEHLAWSYRFSQAVSGLFSFVPTVVFGLRHDLGFSDVLQMSLGSFTLLATLATVLAPTRQASGLGHETEERLRALLAQWGDRDSLGYFALRRDKTAIFSPSGKAAVGYRVVGGVSLAAGDPIGDPEAWPGAIQAWLDEAASYAWVPGVMGASEPGAVAYHRAGLDALELGDEAVVEVADFSLEGRAMRTVRQAVRRVERAGYTARVARQCDLEPETLARIARAAEEYRTEDVERGFSMALGRIGDPDDGEAVIAVAEDGEGVIQALLVFAPWGGHGLSLDVMRRARTSENGTMEFLVTSVLAAAPGLGVQRVSLNFAVFRSVFERGARVGAGPVLRLWHSLLLFASRWWQIESLYRANAKYQPVWEPRFMCFRRPGELPRVVLGALEAEAFVQRPKLRWFAR